MYRPRRYYIRLVETSSCFMLYLEKYGKGLASHGCGDGVDQEFDGLTVGQNGFVESWQKDIDANFEEYMQAYFPDHYNYYPTY